MKTCAHYIAAVKAALGDPNMTDLRLADELGYSQPTIHRAKNGNMSDPMALRVAALLNVEPGEVLLVARAARERDPAVSAALLAYVGKVLGTAQQTAQLAAEGWRKRFLSPALAL